MTALQPFKIDRLKLEDGRRIFVVRDDLVPGGTKQRVLSRILQKGKEYVYPAPVFGYAQIALALVARDVGAKATIFVAKRKTSGLHERTVRAQKAGARIVEVPFGMLSVVTARVREYTLRTKNAVMLEEGFDFPDFHTAMAEVTDAIKSEFEEVWCVACTGALCRALQQRWPNAQFNAIRVGMVPNLDGPAAKKLYVAPETYARDAKVLPPYPSCSNSDAKTWRFVLEHAESGAMVWNVAR